jgi:uncharacterized protein
MLRSLLLFVCFTPSWVFSVKIDSFYGSIEVNEPVILELIESPTFQRLKSIHQYGISYYTTHHEEYTRYDHSIGVFVVLREKGASLDEQIAGLLHDVSHTVFSHVGDWIFGKEYYEENYQDSIHLAFLEKTELSGILKKHQMSSDKVAPKEDLFPALKQGRPNLCADRIDYNIQGAYHQKFITYEEAQEIFRDLHFVEGIWVATNKELMTKLVRFSLFMSMDCWSSPINYISSRWLADAILYGLEKGILSQDDIHFGTDQAVLDTLNQSTDPFIQKKMEMVFLADQYFYLAEGAEANACIKAKFSGIDPWMRWEGKIVRLTSLDETLAEEFCSTKKKMGRGWQVRMVQGAEL